MSRQSILEHLGQYSVLVFQNDGADTLVKYLQEQCFNAWAVDEENALSEIAKDNIDVAFPTEQEAIECIKELEDSTNENYREQ